MKPVTQYLTAVFELRPSRRKAAALERVRSAAEGEQRSLVCDVAMVDCSCTEKNTSGRKAWPSLTAVVLPACCMMTKGETLKAGDVNA